MAAALRLKWRGRTRAQIHNAFNHLNSLLTYDSEQVAKGGQPIWSPADHNTVATVATMVQVLLSEKVFR